MVRAKRNAPAPWQWRRGFFGGERADPLRELRRRGATVASPGDATLSRVEVQNLGLRPWLDAPAAGRSRRRGKRRIEQHHVRGNARRHAQAALGAVGDVDDVALPPQTCRDLVGERRRRAGDHDQRNTSLHGTGRLSGGALCRPWRQRPPRRGARAAGRSSAAGRPCTAARPRGRRSGEA